MDKAGCRGGGARSARVYEGRVCEGELMGMSVGGGGKGMRVVLKEKDFHELLEMAKVGLPV